MALIPIRVDRTSQPASGTPLRSDGHWSVRGLISTYPLAEGGGASTIEVVSGYRAAVGSGIEWVPGGVVGANSGSITNKITGKSLSPFAQNWGGITVVCVCGNLSLNTYSGAGLCTQVADGALSGAFNLTAESSGTSTYVYFRTTSDATYGSTTGTLPTGPRTMTIFGTWDLSTIAADIIADNGWKAQKVSKTLVTPWASGADTAPMRLLQHYRAAYRTLVNVPVYLYLIYSRALTNAERLSLAANPWQIYEPETVWIEVGGGAEAALFAGTIYGQSSVSAQLSTAIAIASQVVAVGSISGGINTAIRLATSTQGSALASALLTTAIRMAAGAQGYGASTADLSTTIALAADILAASSASGTLSTAIRFGGALSGSSTTTAALTNAIALAAQAAGLGSISGQLAGTVAAALFAGTIQGSSSASANLSTAVVLAAAAQGNATAQAALSTALELAAQVNGLGSAGGALGADISGLAGSLHGSSEAQATLSTAIHLMGLAAGQCGVVGRLAEPVEILAQLRVMASDPLALAISVRDPLALRVTVH